MISPRRDVVTREPNDLSHRHRRPADLLLLVGGAMGLLLAVVALSGWTPWQADGSARHGRKAPPAQIAAEVMKRDAALRLAPVRAEVAPVQTLDLSPDVARQVNALIPIASIPNPAARPFLFSGSAQDAAAATACLTAAGYYEAGNDAMGQAAVMQAVLNRVRHPAFPKTICGVVLQGWQRSTGCQFSFTCDGSMTRRSPTPAALNLARATAGWALHGGVFRAVGYATHYHADYVVPRWSSAMDKLLAFHSHLFLRWRGGAGDPGVFQNRYAGGEDAGPLARFMAAAPADITTEPGQGEPGATQAGDGASTATLAPTSGQVIRNDDWRRIFYIYVSPDAFSGSYAVAAWNACARFKDCRVYGWMNLRAVPVVVTEAVPAGVVFTYRKTADGGQEMLWDCRVTPRRAAGQCLPGTAAPDAAANGQGKHP